VSQPSPLEARVAALEAIVAELAREVVTRRVTVVDDDGVARVVLSASLGTGSVLARLDRPDGQTAGIELFASDVDGEAPSLGLCELDAGDVLPLVELIGADDEDEPIPPVERIG
jgi:hypothetical protein